MEETTEQKAQRDADVSRKAETAPENKPEQPAPTKKRKRPKDVRVPEGELNELREKAALVEQYFDRLLRLQADFENFRKRKEKERLETIKYATEELVCELVPILSNFERALAAAEKASHVKGFADGVELILKQFKKVLKERGIEEICPVDAPFDPYKHEAIEKVITSDLPEGHVVEVFRTGYALNDRVLQPAAVKVAVAPPPAASEAGGKEASSPGAQQEGNAPEKIETETSEESEIKEGETNG